MSRKAIIIILLCLSWPVNNLHRLLNAYPETWGYWYPFCRYKEELQWHVRAIGESTAYLCIFIAMWLYITAFRKKYTDITLIFTGFVIVQAIDLIHYLGWHRQSEAVLTIQALIFIAIPLIIFYKKRMHGQTR